MSAARVGVPAPARVLLVDDDPTIHGLVGAMLKTLGVHMEFATNGADGIAMARHDPPDLVLLDHNMPGLSGMDVLQQIKSDPDLSSLQVIMQTGSEDRNTLSACFTAGAIDYIRKPFAAAELRARVGSVLERKRMMLELTNAAKRDRLTGLANRALLHDRLTAAIARSARDPEYGFTVMFLDFDRFKLVNDTLGHNVGDLLLRAIADRLRNNLRASDVIARETDGTTVARLGGDEFVAILDGVSAPSLACMIADRLLNALNEPYELGSHLVRSSASIGMVYSAAGYQNADDMLRDADIAMYEAKARGRGRHVSFTIEMRDAIRERLSTENDLREALGTNQLTLSYQPIISLDDRTICGVEALARWRHPTRGVVSPGTFIPIAEETGLILPLSDFILREACEAFMRWQRSTPARPLEFMSVNLSRVQFSDPTLVERTMLVVRDSGMLPHQLLLEVTESQIMQNRDVALRLLAEFRDQGVRLAMDDFGTGYSSLSCLQEFPLDVLKVDRSFVANAKRGRDFAALLHAVVTLADNLGLKVVAEGIEDADQLTLLQALGCAYGQGYLLARPMPEDELTALLGVPFDGPRTGKSREGDAAMLAALPREHALTPVTIGARSL